MKELRGVRRTVPPHLTRPSLSAGFDQEMRFHLERIAQDLREGGLGPEEAWAEAVCQFGNAEKLRAEVREINGPWEGKMKRAEWFNSLGQDLSYALRQLRKNPGFAFVAILTLALGVGVTTAMFTVVNGVLFQSLPFPEPDRLVAVAAGTSEMMAERHEVGEEHFMELRRQSSPFAHVTTYMNATTSFAYSDFPPATLTVAGEPVKLNATSVTAEFLEVLGVRPVFGRGFQPGDDEDGASPVVVLGNALWRARFGADPDVVGTTTTLDGVSRTITGVMPRGFDFPDGTDLWFPLQVNPSDERFFGGPVVARLRENITVNQAAAELSTFVIASGWRSQSGDAFGARLRPLKDLVVGESRYPLLIFTGAVALVLLISCTNVANLLLMRAGSREREIGLRRVLGAGRPRLVRQLLTESVVVAFLGGGVGIVVAAVGVEALLALAPQGTIPRGHEVRIDLTVLAFTLVVSTATGLAFGIAPALMSSRHELRDTLAEAARALSPRGGVVRGVLVVAEVGLAVVLLTGAGLLLRSFQQIRTIDLGFRPENTLTFDVDLPANVYSDAGSMRSLHSRVLDGLTQMPRVEAAGAANHGPFSVAPLPFTRVSVEGRSEERVTVGWTMASPGYFRAMGIPVLAGRGFTVQDDATAPGAIIVNRSMAEQLWPNRDPIGQRLSRRPNWGASDWLTIVGVVDDVLRSNEITASKGPVVFLPYAQVNNPYQLRHMRFVVRTAGSAQAMAPAMRAVLRTADPNLAAGAIITMDEVVLSTIAGRIFQTRILGAFAVLALLLAAVGVYGVTAYSVNARTQEIAIRMAVGARVGEIAGMTIGRVLKLVVPGLLLGSAAGVAAARLIAASLYGVTPADPATFIGVALLLGGVAVLAALVPTRRAMRISPIDVLRG